MEIYKVIEDNPYMVSDTHFNHKKIIELCNRPVDWQETFITHWNNTVNTDDNVFHLGDFAMGGKHDAIDIINRLKGNIYLLPGNHDYDKINVYKRETKLIILDDDFIWYSNLIFSHRPILTEAELFLQDAYNIHGHIHNNVVEGLGNRHINISIEVMDYKLIRLTDLISSFKG
jgi:calcineurin-like phosphoesterase family protein